MCPLLAKAAFFDFLGSLDVFGGGFYTKNGPNKPPGLKERGGLLLSCGLQMAGQPRRGSWKGRAQVTQLSLIASDSTEPTMARRFRELWEILACFGMFFFSILLFFLGSV